MLSERKAVKKQRKDQKGGLASRKITQFENIVPNAINNIPLLSENCQYIKRFGTL
jgi:hypothetical protein